MKLIQIAIVFLFLFSQNVYAKNDELCIKEWNRLLDRVQKAEQKMNDGTDILHSKPRRAFDFYNKAHSSAKSFDNVYSSFSYLAIECKDTTNITKREAREMDEIAEGIKDRSACGMKITSFVRGVDELDNKIDRYNAAIDSNFSNTLYDAALSAKISTESSLKQLNTIVNYTHTCDREGDLIDFVNSYKSDLRDNLEVFKDALKD